MIQQFLKKMKMRLGKLMMLVGMKRSIIMTNTNINNA